MALGFGVAGAFGIVCPVCTEGGTFLFNIGGRRGVGSRVGGAMYSKSSAGGHDLGGTFLLAP